ncbi:MAG TPA: outer membrane lipoprotein carrier protein LolA [Vicinamibacterales bacterium]|nr:outer membrane lipoprotein carrier protein LolA [Vicinamibacterales bacterium]
MSGAPFFASLLVLALVPASATRERSAAEVARALEARYARVRDFTASFVQTYEGGVLRRRVVERGTVRVKRPGRMRWEYREPEKKLFVADGRRLYAYIPADRQVIVTDLPEGDEATTAALFLAGRGDLTRDFEASFGELPGAPPGSIVLRLTPRRPERDYDWLLLALDASTLQIRMLVAGDRQGGRSTFTFSDVRENVGLSDKTFEFSIPRGVDVVRGGPPA